MVLDRKTNFFLEETKKIIFWATTRPKSKIMVVLVSPRKKLVFLPKTIFSLGEKLVFLPKTIFFLGKTKKPIILDFDCIVSQKMVFFPRKKLVFLPKTIFFLGKSWFSTRKSFFAEKRKLGISLQDQVFLSKKVYFIYCVCAL